MSIQFTTKQIAGALKVSESSVKRWCDLGRIQFVRTVGGHRRIPAIALYAFLDETKTQLLNPNALGVVSNSDVGQRGITDHREPARLSPKIEEHLVNEFKKALIDGNEDASDSIMTQWLGLQPGIATLADRLITKVFESIGECWERNELEIYQERRACEICNRLIQNIRRRVQAPPPNAPFAMGGSPSHNNYLLPNQLVEFVLTEAQWNAKNIGTNLPFSTMLAAIEHRKPKLFWLSVSHIEDDIRFVSEFQEFASKIPMGVSLVVGGRALNDKIRPKLSFTAHCDNMLQLSNFAKTARTYLPN